MSMRRRPEIELLLNCATTQSTEQNTASIERLLEKELDWSEVLRLAAWHRVSALLFLHFRSRKLAGQLPRKSFRKLQFVYLKNQVRYRSLQENLRKVLAALDSEGLPTIVLKGAALAETVYPDAALRPMADIDILIEEHNLDRADDVIRSLGYSSGYSRWIQQRARESHRHYPGLSSPDGSTLVEIHRHIVRKTSTLQFDIPGFWSRARFGTIHGTEALLLAPEDLLIHLCLNFFQDSLRLYPSHAALGKLTDISETLRHHGDRFDWSLFVSNVIEYGIAGPVVCTLQTNRDLFRSAWPDQVLKKLSAEEVPRSSIELFIAKKVLRAAQTSWYFHELVDPPDRATAANELKSALRRCLSDRFELEIRYRSKPTLRLWLRHLGEVSQAFARSVARPYEFCQDLQIDRWMHSLMGRRSA